MRKIGLIGAMGENGMSKQDAGHGLVVLSRT